MPNGVSPCGFRRTIVELPLKKQAVASEQAPPEEFVPLRVAKDSNGGERLKALTDHEALLACLGDLLFQVNAEGTLLEAHCPADHEFQLSQEGLVGRNLSDLLTEPLRSQGMEWLRTTLNSGEPCVFELEYPLGDRRRVFQVRLVPCERGCVMALVRDATARFQFEKEILEVSQRTQHRIGQDLHDNLGQHLTGITFLSKALERKLSARKLPEAKDAGEIVQMVINVLSQTRQLARSLFPMELESGELVEALREMAGSVETVSKATCQVLTSEGLVVRNPDVANHLFRLTQEAVNNAVKHGNPTRIEINLLLEGDLLLLRIQDNGGGCEVQRSTRTGLGMRIMQYRAQKIGGRLEFVSSPEEGTEVKCSLPVATALATAESPTTSP